MARYALADRRLYAMLEYSDEMIALLGRGGEILFASPATRRWLGYDVAAFTGHCAYDFVHPDDVNAARDALAGLTHGSDPVCAEARLRHRDGSWHLLRGTFRNLLDDPAVGAIVVNYRDITDVRAAELAHRALQDRVAQIVDSVGVGAWTLDLATAQAEWSEQIAALLGMPPDQFDGCVETVFAHLHPDDREKVQRASAVAIDTHSPFDVEFRVVLPDGTSRWLENKGRVKYDADGRATHIGGVAQDISARKLLEAQLQEAQKLDALGRLAGGVAHDFNNVLQAILGFAEIVADDLDHNRSVDVTEIMSAARSGTALTRQLLAFSRKQRIEPRRLSLNSVIANSELMLQRLIGEDIDVRVKVDPNVDDIWADEGQIEQIFVNLAVNARDAMPDGGRLTIETSNVELTRDYAGFHAPVAPGSYVQLAVSDTGRGMSADVQARMFEPFFTTKSIGQGTGFGLSTVYGIVRQSGGYIWVASEEGRGTTFNLYFPRIDEATKKERHHMAAHREDLMGHGTVLLVEDNDQIRRLAVRTLGKYGYAVLDAATPDAAIALAASSQLDIDLLITDVVLPGMNGRSLAEELRRDRPSLKCVFMSGYTGDVVAPQLAIPGDSVFLQKPFTADGLARQVRDLLVGAGRTATT
jgi:PAS domain S-box-containing protein